MKSERWKNFLKNGALFGASFLLCFLALEMVLRVAGYGNLEVYQPDPVLYWRLKPNQNCFTKIDRKPVHINSLGARGREMPVEKPSNTIRILSLGDSRTFGWGLSEEETYSGQLENLLQQKAGAGKRIEVINAGVNAWSYPQMHAYFRDYGLKFQPDFVVLAGANLWTQFSESNPPEFVQAFMRRVWLKNFLRRFATYHYIIEVQLEDFYQRYRTRFIPVNPQTDTLFQEQQKADPEAFFRKHIESLCQLAQGKGVTPILLFLPTLDDLVATNQSMALKADLEVRRKFNVPLVDLTPDLEPGGKSLYLEADPVHLNAEGNRLIARRLAEKISELMIR